MSSRLLSEAELEALRARVETALSVLTAVERGDYGSALEIEFDSQSPIDSAFAGINELITAFQTEHEQSCAFRIEIEDKLTTLEKQRAAIRELSTPVIELWQGVLCLPIVGMIDTARSVEMTSALLQAVVDKGAKCVIVDITGIEVMDTRTVDHFIRMAKAVRLLGAECALTGISPYIAQTVVTMGLDLSDIVAHRSLCDALVAYVDQDS